ncbi:MAG TPA: hypothetical protein DHW20_02725, partial [Gemmatimonadetes bacterium]|nr:hypothetical protein [Gemmatimonadota bacterium]
MLPANVGAQELLDPPLVILTDVPFELTLQGASQTSTQYEVRSATGLILAEGTILPQGVSVVTGLEIGSIEQLPLQVLIGDRSDELEPTL